MNVNISIVQQKLALKNVRINLRLAKINPKKGKGDIMRIFIISLFFVFCFSFYALTEETSSLTSGKTYEYACTCMKGETQGEKVDLTLKDDGLTIVYLNHENHRTQGKYDPSYRPTANKNFVRYTNPDSTNEFDDAWFVLVQKDLLLGGKMLEIGIKGGYIQDGGRSLDYYNVVNYFCVNKK